VCSISQKSSPFFLPYHRFLQVMRFEAGGSVDDLLHTPSTHLSMADKMTLICQSVTAIAELHCIGVIHGDLKPANNITHRQQARRALSLLKKKTTTHDTAFSPF